MPALIWLVTDNVQIAWPTGEHKEDIEKFYRSTKRSTGPTGLFFHPDHELQRSLV